MKYIVETGCLLLAISLVACDGKVRFAAIDVGSKQDISPTSPVVDPPAPKLVKNQGHCAADSSTSVTSCMKCQIPALPPVEPPMSLKAKQLMSIMAAVCPINNSYYGNKYVTPTLADLQGQLNRCSPALYADSTPDGGQNDVVQRLLNGDSALRNKMFTGLYYHPPYTDYFETYFGLEVQEAIDIFCNKNSYNVSGTLIPSMTMSNPYGPIYQAGDPLPSMYVKANNYRSGLSACLPLSRNQPWQPPAPATPKSCDFETVSGDAGEDVNSQVSSWLTQGYTVGADLKNTNQCVSVTSLQDLAGYQGSLTVGAYRCQ